MFSYGTIRYAKILLYSNLVCRHNTTSTVDAYVHEMYLLPVGHPIIIYYTCTERTDHSYSPVVIYPTTMYSTNLKRVEKVNIKTTVSREKAKLCSGVKIASFRV